MIIVEILVCIGYSLFVSNIVALYQIQSFCIGYRRFVSDTVDLYQIQLVCIRYGRFVLDTVGCIGYSQCVSDKVSRFVSVI